MWVLGENFEFWTHMGYILAKKDLEKYLGPKFFQKNVFSKKISFFLIRFLGENFHLSRQRRRWPRRQRPRAPQVVSLFPLYYGSGRA